MPTRPVTDDLELIGRIARRDEAALGDLYDRYVRVLFGLGLKILTSPEEAEEVVLDVFGQVWRTADRYNVRRARVDSWLFMITRSRALDRLRSQQRASRSVEASEQIAVVEEPVRITDPEQDALFSERRHEILSAIGMLPTGQRQAIELVYYEGLSHTEVADRTGEPLGTIKTRVRMGLLKLREALAPSWGSVRS